LASALFILVPSRVDVGANYRIERLISPLPESIVSLTLISAHPTPTFAAQARISPM
jgi:hypothetical protein